MEENLRQTCLYAQHLALGAKMSPFAGYIMPIQYAGIAEEHRAVRSRAGLFDVSHMGEILIRGREAEKLVNHLFTNDVRGMEPGGIQYGMLLYDDGGTVDDLLVYKEFAPDTYLLVVNAANTEKDFAWIKAHAGGYEAEIENQSAQWGQLALQGPDSARILTEKLHFPEADGLKYYTFTEWEDAGGRYLLSRTGYTGEDGFEIYAAPEAIVPLWRQLLEAGAEPCGLGCRDTLRFEAGLPLYGDELSPEISPIMAGFGLFCKLDKEEFIGREALLAQKAAGTERKLVGMELLDKAIPRAGYPVETDDGTQVGTVTTGYRSITLDRSLCFALVKREYAALGTALRIRIRRKVFPAVVVRKRFYKR